MKYAITKQLTIIETIEWEVEASSEEEALTIADEKGEPEDAEVSSKINTTDFRAEVVATEEKQS